MRYEEPEEGEWVQPVRKGYKMACCDCGLVHNLDFRLVGSGKRRFIQFRVFRNNRSTAMVRRHRNIEVNQGMGGRMTSDERAAEFIKGWVSGYLEHGGGLADEGIADKAVAAFERRFDVAELPSDFDAALWEAAAVAQEAEA